MQNKTTANTDGQDKVLTNVIYGWFAQLIFVVSGFILPRMIDEGLGQNALGVWDFAWTLITYFELIYGGSVSSINRYVAKHRSAEDIEGVNISTSSIFFVLVVMAVLIALLSILSALLIPFFLKVQLAEHVVDAQWIVFLLGMSLVMKIFMAVYGGVLTGCHRWDLHHSINAVNRLFSMLGMIMVIYFGGNLQGLALVYLLSEVVVLSFRPLFAYRICPGLKIKLSYFRWDTAKNMFSFGMKTLIPDLGELLRNQTLNFLIVCFLGPAALAVFARSRSLIRHIQTFLLRYAFTLTPTASAIQALNHNEKIMDLFISSSKIGALITFPMILIVIILGKPLMTIWMGDNYLKHFLLIILAIGNLPILLQLPMISIFRGLNSHGRPGVVKFISSIIGIVFAAFVLGNMGLGVIEAIIAVLLPLWFIEVLYNLYFAKKRYDLPILHFLKTSIGIPFIYSIPFACCLFVAEFLLDLSPLVTILCGLSVGSVILFATYWQFAFSRSMKSKIILKLNFMTKQQ